MLGYGFEKKAWSWLPARWEKEVGDQLTTTLAEKSSVAAALLLVSSSSSSAVQSHKSRADRTRL
jgi:hypothetical protein